MGTFIERFGQFVLGILCGFDRLRFRGSKRQLCNVGGVLSFLGHIGVKLRDYKGFAKATTVDVCRAIEERAKEAGLYRYVNNSKESKEESALALARERKRSEGLIAVLGCVEPCQILQVRGDRKTKLLAPRIEPGKCLHYYHYYLDKDYGLRYTRMQSWFPFTTHVGLNGREWLARQMTKAGLRYTQEDNCFTWIEDWQEAQRLMDEQLTTAWSPLLEGWAQESNPLATTRLFELVPYYWAVQEAEYATDIAFRSAADLGKLYPRLVHQAYAGLKSTDVLRFMGYRVRPDGQPWQNFAGELRSTIKKLMNGICVKHRLKNNLLKMYDKFAQVLRLENLLIDVRDFKVFRTREGDTEGPKEYLRLRKGVADMHRRAELGRKINERYAEALAQVEETTPLAELTEDLARRTQWHGRSVRALNPGDRQRPRQDRCLACCASRGHQAASPSGVSTWVLFAQPGQKLNVCRTDHTDEEKAPRGLIRVIGVIRG
jgi:hypothetical protein